MTLGWGYTYIVTLSLLPPCVWSSSTVSIFRREVWQHQQFDKHGYLEAEPAFTLSAMSAIL